MFLRCGTKLAGAVISDPNRVWLVYCALQIANDGSSMMPQWGAVVKLVRLPTGDRGSWVQVPPAPYQAPVAQWSEQGCANLPGRGFESLRGYWGIMELPSLRLSSLGYFRLKAGRSIHHASQQRTTKARVWYSLLRVHRCLVKYVGPL